eukprot:7459494-Pyramimonas_sp.AAC.1
MSLIRSTRAPSPAPWQGRAEQPPGRPLARLQPELGPKFQSPELHVLGALPAIARPLLPPPPAL